MSSVDSVGSQATQTRKHRSAFRRIADNAVSLFALQGLTYLVSFLTVPYLLRTLGTASFGSIAFANTVMAQFILLTDFGFASSATRLVAIHAKEGKELGRLFSSVMVVKGALLLISAVAVFALALCVPRFSADRTILGVAFLQVLGSTLFPVWLFQGLERMRWIAGISIVSRLLSTGLTFLLVHHPADAVIAIACQSGGVLLQGLIAVLSAVTIFGVRPCIPKLSEIQHQVRDSFHPFLGASLGNLVGGSSVLFMGFFQSMATVGSYAAVERTARAEVMALLPISQAAYPHISQRFHESRAAGNRAILRLCGFLLGGALVFLSGVSLFSARILHLLYGKELTGETHLFAAFSVWAFFSLLNTLLGLHYLIASGHANIYGRSVFWSALTTISLFVFTIPHLGSWGALLSVVFGEFMQTAIMVSGILTINRSDRQTLDTMEPTV